MPEPIPMTPLSASQVSIHEQLADLAVQQHLQRRNQQMMQTELQDIKKLLDETSTTVSEVRDLFAALKGGVKVLGWLGTGVKWLGFVAAGCTAVYTAAYMLTHGGTPPNPSKF